MTMHDRAWNDNPELLRTVFERLDVHSTGFIERDDLRLLMGHGISDEALEAAIAEVDIAGNGKISFDEFTAVMVSKGADTVC